MYRVELYDRHTGTLVLVTGPYEDPAPGAGRLYDTLRRGIADEGRYSVKIVDEDTGQPVNREDLL